MKNVQGSRSDNSELENGKEHAFLLDWSDNTNLSSVQFGRDGLLKIRVDESTY